jgi:signal transduction histidine kinase
MKSEIKLLVLEDVEEDFELIQRTLKKAGLRFEARLVDTKSDYLKALSDYTPDVILSDHSLPQFNSTEAFEFVKHLPSRIPFIIVTGNVSEEFAVNSIKQGIDDYVLKSNLQRLPEAVETAVRKREEQKARERELKELEENNQELARYNKDLETFVNSVSTNLRNPLSSMLNVLNIIKKEENNDVELQGYVEMMETSIQKLDDVLADMEVQSDGFQPDLNPEIIDLDKTIEDQLDLMQYMPGADVIEKDIRISSEEIFYSDAYHLNVIVNNLISNSFKYYDPKKKNPYLRITVQVSKTRAYFEFRDNGIGIDGKSVSKIFEKFFRANGEQEGTGIGLHLVKTSIDKLQGTIDVKSSLGQGTIFKIQIPNLLPADRPSTQFPFTDRNKNKNRTATA